EVVGIPHKNRMLLYSFYCASEAEPRDHIQSITPRSLPHFVASMHLDSNLTEVYRDGFDCTGNPKE
ncbi:hypothetical protein AOQ84DRAFT_301715, partial [Glonium stellatum]